MAEGKAELRRRMLESRKELGEALRKSKSEAICSRILSILEQTPSLAQRGKSLFTYMPFGDETDIFPVVEWCWKKGYAVAAPKTICETRALRLYLIDSPSQLEPGTWGIPEPVEGAPEADLRDIGVVIVPGVAFDQTGGRMGYGGGYYDRFFTKLKEQGLKPLKLAPAFDIQLIEHVPMEPHDERMDLIITETAVYSARGT